MCALFSDRKESNNVCTSTKVDMCARFDTFNFFFFVLCLLCAISCQCQVKNRLVKQCFVFIFFVAAACCRLKVSNFYHVLSGFWENFDFYCNLQLVLKVAIDELVSQWFFSRFCSEIAA